MTIQRKHAFPQIEMRLSQMLSAGDWSALPPYFSALSVAQFRAAGPLLAARMAKELVADDYWNLTKVMVNYHSRAFLVTLLKAAVANKVSFDCQSFADFCKSISGKAIDVEKAFSTLFPVFDGDPQSILRLLTLLQVTEARQRVRLLLRQDSDAACYVLFHTLNYLENDRPFLLRTVKFLIQKQDERSYNFASLLTSHFGLSEVKAVFSLHIEPYQLAWLQGSFSAFRKALKK